MGERKPYTLRDRRRMADQFGHRPTNNWQAGTLPAPWAEGDVVRRMDSLSDERLYGMPGDFFVVCYATSIDEGDGWYFRVWDGEAERRSDRLHVVYAERSQWDESVDWMGAFRLVDTADPDGLALRERLIAAGWALGSQTCWMCDGSGVVPMQPEENIGDAGAADATGAGVGQVFGFLSHTEGNAQ